MGILTGKHLPRRTFLRGMGATVALPFLEAMVPARKAFGASRVTGAIGADRTRLVCIEMVHGAAGSTKWGSTQHLWSPAAEGRDFDLGPTALSSLEPYQKYLTVVSDTDLQNAGAFIPEAGGRRLTFEVRDGAIVDRETGSTWNVLGLATDGPLAGSTLEPVLSGNHFWFAWSVFEPETRVVTGG